MTKEQEDAINDAIADDATKPSKGYAALSEASGSAPVSSVVGLLPPRTLVRFTQKGAPWRGRWMEIIAHMGDGWTRVWDGKSDDMYDVESSQPCEYLTRAAPVVMPHDRAPICKHCDGSGWSDAPTPVACPHCVDGRVRGPNDQDHARHS